MFVTNIVNIKSDVAASRFDSGTLEYINEVTLKLLIDVVQSLREY